MPSFFLLPASPPHQKKLIKLFLFLFLKVKNPHQATNKMYAWVCYTLQGNNNK